MTETVNLLGHGVKGFTRTGGRIIEEMAQRALPAECQALVINHHAGPLADVWLFWPDGSQYFEAVDYTGVVLTGDAPWWESTFCDVLRRCETNAGQPIM